MVRIDGNLKEVLAQLAVEAELVGCIRIYEKRAEAALRIGGIVNDRGYWRFEAIVGASSGDAGIPCRFLRVVTGGERSFAGVEVAAGDAQLPLAVAFKTIAGRDVEDAVGTVANVGGIASALDFNLIGVRRSDLRTHIRGDVGVGDIDAVDEPTGLVASAHMKHVVAHVGAGHVIGYGSKRRCATGARRLLDHLSAYQRSRRYGIHLSRRSFHFYGFRSGGDRQRDMHNRVGAGRYGDGFYDCGESGSANLQVVDADGSLLQVELAF